MNNRKAIHLTIVQDYPTRVELANRYLAEERETLRRDLARAVRERTMGRLLDMVEYRKGHSKPKGAA